MVTSHHKENGEYFTSACAQNDTQQVSSVFGEERRIAEQVNHNIFLPVRECGRMYAPTIILKGI